MVPSLTHVPLHSDLCGKRARLFSVSNCQRVSDDEGDISTQTEFVDLAMLTMDDQHGTKFYDWIRSEKNVSGICLQLAPFVAEFESAPPHVITRAMVWLTEGWSAASVAELLIKLFFHWEIGHPQFANLVRRVVEDRPVATFTSELVTTLVVGERARHAAALIRHLTQPWPVGDVTEMVATICQRLKWKPQYFRKFIVHYIKLDDSHKRMTDDVIRRKFDVRDQTAAVSGGKNQNSEIQFCASLFEMCVIEAQELVARRQVERTALEKPLAKPTGNSRG